MVARVLCGAGAVDGSQGQVRAQRARCPWITDKKRASPGGATDTLARFCRPSRPVLLFQTFQGLRASRSPLATICRACGAQVHGYHLARLRRSVHGYHLPRLRRSNDHIPDCPVAYNRRIPSTKTTLRDCWEDNQQTLNATLLARNVLQPVLGVASQAYLSSAD
jgi:hypothetical protein